MASDEIIEEIRQSREAYAAKFNYNLRAIYEDLKKLEAEHIRAGHPFVEPPIEAISDNKSLHRTATALPLRSDR